MDVLTIALLISMAFGGWQFDRANDLDDEIKNIEAEKVALIKSSELNLKNAKISAEIANENKDVANRINDDLTQCVKDLEDFGDSISIFEAAKEYDKAVIKKLETRTSSSSLNQCFIPDWLADEITSDSLQNGSR
jgi:dGTP triphosphohydrolase|tara:strand:+ start:421 stop:825 length:405 start_codon:yes stop_codon:yes gene_type:complete